MTRKSKPMLQIGSLSAKSREMPHYIPNDHTFDAPTRVCNASMGRAAPGEITKLMTSAVRPGALAFMECRSFGQGC